MGAAWAVEEGSGWAGAAPGGLRAGAEWASAWGWVSAVAGSLWAWVPARATEEEVAV
ncbi:hypothetical protein GCM10009601_22690 [Streptomyces thermospinosisporus]|uniref:Uncharacterized protein n=1 Tax=Streptomyces thermospinosisporus TaxID=161482 RepID=A0ABP4JHB2_9ACTN